MSYEMIVKHCAPTLAGLKTGNLFTYSFDDEETLFAQLKHNNNLLNKKGIYVRILRLRTGLALIYVYRANRLQTLLQEVNIQNFLKTKGYHDFTIEVCLNLLESHLDHCDFPHEIGIFLGYPLADVEAFITHKGSNYKYVGYWKVYNNLDDALSTFEKYKKCTHIYCEKYASGYDISKLTVAC